MINVWIFRGFRCSGSTLRLRLQPLQRVVFRRVRARASEHARCGRGVRRAPPGGETRESAQPGGAAVRYGAQGRCCVSTGIQGWVQGRVQGWVQVWVQGRDQGWVQGQVQGQVQGRVQGRVQDRNRGGPGIEPGENTLMGPGADHMVGLEEGP